MTSYKNNGQIDYTRVYHTIPASGDGSSGTNYDQTDYGWGPGGPRAAWRATGTPEGPKHKNESSGLANLAGRAAAAMALAGDPQTAESMYRLARRHPGSAMSVPVRAPYYYGERTFHDDLEWAAIELHIDPVRDGVRCPRTLLRAVGLAMPMA